MPLAKDVATELRKIADGFDREPDAEMPYAFVSFTHHTKESFLAMARVMPRPIEKQVTDSNLRLKYKNEAITLWVDVPQSLTCVLITPAHDAVYRCEPILSLIDIEESALTAPVTA